MDRMRGKKMESGETLEERWVDGKVLGMGITTGEDCEPMPDMIKALAKNP